MAEKSRFNEVLGELPMLVGVYTRAGNSYRTPTEMIEEVRILDNMCDERGGPAVSGVYLENNGRTGKEVEILQAVLSGLSICRPRTKLGVSIFPNFEGTEFVTAFNLAEKYELPFIAQDIVAGHYEIEGKSVRTLETETFLKMRSESDAVVIGGVLPPYAESPHAGIESGLVAASAAPRVDALMVKKRPEEKKVPISRITNYKEWSGKPVIVASRVGLDNISEYVRLANGFIVGGGARLGERLCKQYIVGMANIVVNERERRAGLVGQE